MPLNIRLQRRNYKMRQVLMVLALVLCFCGCAYAATEDNPFQSAARLASETSAAEYLYKFSQEGGVHNIVQMDDGFGGYIVFHPGVDPEGVYSIANISHYKKDLCEAEEEFLDFLMLIALGLLFLFVGSGASAWYLMYRNETSKINLHRLWLMEVFAAIMKLILLGIIGVAVCYMYYSSSLSKGIYNTSAYQTVLEDYVQSGSAEFYHREEIGKLLEKYAVMYENQINGANSTR